MKRYDIINYLIEKYKYKKYLEIGVGQGYCFSKVECETKHSVDTSWPSTFNMTSHKFFDELPDDETYDLIFIDADHSKRVVEKDIANSLKHISSRGIVLAHDMNPTHERFARKRPKEGRPTWFGDGYKCLMALRTKEENLIVRCIDMDCGIGVMRKTKVKQQLIEPCKLQYKVMDSDRAHYIGLISKEEFFNTF